MAAVERKDRQEIDEIDDRRGQSRIIQDGAPDDLVGGQKRKRRHQAEAGSHQAYEAGLKVGAVRGFGNRDAAEERNQIDAFHFHADELHGEDVAELVQQDHDRKDGGKLKPPQIAKARKSNEREDDP